MDKLVRLEKLSIKQTANNIKLHIRYLESCRLSNPSQTVIYDEAIQKANADLNTLTSELEQYNLTEHDHELYSSYNICKFLSYEDMAQESLDALQK